MSVLYARFSFVDGYILCEKGYSYTAKIFMYNSHSISTSVHDCVGVLVKCSMQKGSQPGIATELILTR